MERAILHSEKDTLLNCVDTYQYAYKSKSSTVCALIDIENSITTYLDDNKCKCMILISCDLSKAFDSISHARLIQKLLNFNNMNHNPHPIPCGLIKFLISYLTGRH